MKGVIVVTCGRCGGAVVSGEYREDVPYIGTVARPPKCIGCGSMPKALEMKDRRIVKRGSA